MPYLLITQPSQLIELISNQPQVYNIKQMDAMLTGGLEEQLIKFIIQRNEPSNRTHQFIHLTHVESSLQEVQFILLFFV